LVLLSAWLSLLPASLPITISFLAARLSCRQQTAEATVFAVGIQTIFGQTRVCAGISKLAVTTTPRTTGGAKKNPKNALTNASPVNAMSSLEIAG